tara:strand:+ start:3121 stop:4158 length:1038 start_codon:yes stop_codon:yes gene_type:complete
MYSVNPEWTIGIVNYNSAIYIKWQLKILFESNDPNDFKLIIVDNSSLHQRKELEELTKEYVDKYQNIEIVYFLPTEATASGQHGEGLSLIQEKTTTKYLLVHDPDFFWVQSDYLNCFKEYLEADKNNVAIGAPYPNKIGVGDPWFPSAYGCAYKVASLEKLNFLPDVTENKRVEGFRKYPIAEGFEFSYDVGWKIREKLSNKNFATFSQREAYELKKLIGTHSFEMLTREYFYKNKTIGFHLFRGTFTGAVQNHEDPKAPINNKWVITRNNYGNYFYNYITNKSNFSTAIKRKCYLLIYAIPFLLKTLIYKIILPIVKKTLIGRFIIKKLKQLLIKTKIISRPNN